MRRACLKGSVRTCIVIGVTSLACCPSPASAVFLSCSFVTTTPMAFGNYDVFSGAVVTSTDSVTVNCFGVLNSSVTAVLSKGSSATFVPRTMKNGTNALNYNVYLDAGYTTVFGDGTGGSTVLSGTLPANTNYVQTFYGKIPALQDAAVGAYSDSLTLTLTF